MDCGNGNAFLRTGARMITMKVQPRKFRQPKASCDLVMSSATQRERKTLVHRLRKKYSPMNQHLSLNMDPKMKTV